MVLRPAGPTAPLLHCSLVAAQQSPGGASQALRCPLAHGQQPGAGHLLRRGVAALWGVGGYGRKERKKDSEGPDGRCSRARRCSSTPAFKGAHRGCSLQQMPQCAAGARQPRSNGPSAAPPLWHPPAGFRPCPRPKPASRTAQQGGGWRLTLGQTAVQVRQNTAPPMHRRVPCWANPTRAKRMRTMMFATSSPGSSSAPSTGQRLMSLRGSEACRTVDSDPASS